MAPAAAATAAPLDAAGVRLVTSLAPLELARLKWQPTLPKALQGNFAFVKGSASSSYADQAKIKSLFPHTFGQPSVQLVPLCDGANAPAGATPVSASETPVRLGIVLSGGPASGGHNVLTGVHDYLVNRVHKDSVLYGFLDGPSGLIDSKYIECTAELLAKFRNQGGFHCLGSGRTKIESAEHFAKTAAVCKRLQLDGLVIVGGDDSNTNAALIAEYFRATGHRTRCVGVPKTIDGDLRNEQVEMSFGFDSACKTFSEKVAALCADAVSARKTYHVCRLMGRTASHITLEVALQTHPNVALIGEEVQARGQGLSAVAKSIADIIATRALQNKHYGCIILPEGLVDFLPDVSALLGELNELIAAHTTLPANVTAHLSPASAALFSSLPEAIAQQLLGDRDPHGNVQVAKIESERLVAYLVEQELLRRKRLGTYRGNISIVTHFLGYEGRCGLPSNFDANYCYALGQTAAALLAAGCTGMLAAVQGLTLPPAQWSCSGLPLTHLMNMERRSGHDKPVIRKALVRLEDAPFQIFEHSREAWKYQDCYRNPGSIQYDGPFADEITMTLQLERGPEQDKQRKETNQAQQKAKEGKDIKSNL